MNQAKSKQVSENPFYGMKGLLSMQRTLERTTDENANRTTITALLNEAWKEAYSTKEGRQLFFILMFSFGDIENRQHNMFATTTDQGGHSKRKMFRICLSWALNNVEEYFYTLLPVIAEYTNFENLFYNQIRTDVKSKKLLSWEKMEVDVNKIASYLKEKLENKETTEFERALIAKFLPKPPQKHRWRKDKDGKSFAQLKQQHTLRKDEWTKTLIQAILRANGWDIVDYKKFRSKYLANTEAHLFSSKKICEFDRTQLLSWFEQLPSGARYRVQRRLFDKEGTQLVSTKKWTLKTGQDIGDIYLKWMKDKEAAMKTLASLTDADKKAMAPEQLNRLQKQSKINTGATTIYDLFLDMYADSSGYGLKLTPETAVKIQQLVDKVKIDVPVLCVLDNSTSMSGTLSVGNIRIERMQFAKFVCALMLYKNPDEDLKSFMVKFNSEATVIHDGGIFDQKTGQNRFVTRNNSIKLDQLVKRGEPFIETFRQLDKLIQVEGATHLSSVATSLKKWVDEDANTAAMKIEAIQSYQVLLLISDGDVNNSYNAASSMMEFKNQMLNWFGASPVVVLWDIVADGRNTSSKFENIDNMIHVAGFNASIINQIFVNINDIDVLDVYISLQTAFRSNRYEPIKQLIK